MSRNLNAGSRTRLSVSQLEDRRTPNATSAAPYALGVPDAIWILPSQNVQPVREPDSLRLVDYYAVQTRAGTLRIAPEEIIHFRCPDPRDPYGPGLSPLRAAFSLPGASHRTIAHA